MDSTLRLAWLRLIFQGFWFLSIRGSPYLNFAAVRCARDRLPVTRGGAMALEPRVAANLRFGTYEVDLKSGELRKQGKRIRLQDQPFRVLSVVLQRPGEVVTRDELRAEIWPEDTFVDFDNGLNTTINKLREALGDSSNNPSFIETLPRRGYRFIAPVTSDGDKASAAAFPQPRRTRS